MRGPQTDSDGGSSIEDGFFKGGKSRSQSPERNTMNILEGHRAQQDHSTSAGTLKNQIINIHPVYPEAGFNHETQVDFANFSAIPK